MRDAGCGRGPGGAAGRHREREGATTQKIALEDKLAFLRRPGSYPGHVDQVEVIETHMAWVFLAGAFVYKLKKPVRYAFLDFSTLEARRRDCEAEVRLNLRLAPGVYLATIPLNRVTGSRGARAAADGAELRLGGPGEPVEWLVMMRRLPRARMLDRVIEAGGLEPADVQAVARLLADFYARTPACPIGPSTYVSRLRTDVDDNLRELLAFCPQIPEARVREVEGALTAFLERERPLLEARVREGRIVEGHGDLRPEHVHLGPPPAVIDCIEFNPDFRTLDAVDDLAFLVLECERLGAPEVGGVLLRAYRERTGDEAPPHLLDFYRAHRAFLRAKIALWHLKDGELTPTPDRWVGLGRTYLELAAAHAEGLGG